MYLLQLIRLIWCYLCDHKPLCGRLADHSHTVVHKYMYVQWMWLVEVNNMHAPMIVTHDTEPLLVMVITEGNCLVCALFWI